MSLGFLLLAPATAAADTEKAGVLSVIWENDIFFKTDRDYTNGAEISYTTPPNDNIDAIVGFARVLPLFADQGEVRTSYSIGQDIFTPLHTALTVPLPSERPYAGFSYLSLGLMQANPDRLDQLELQLGVVGPMALAKESQFWVHSIIADVKPKGWHYQLHNEPAVNLYYERSLKVIPRQSLLGVVLDIEPHLGGAVGTVYDYLNAGAMARLGFNLPDDFGPLRMQPALPGSSYFEPEAGFSAYAFAGVDCRVMGRNIFLDGNNWRASPSVDKDRFVGDLTVGAAVTFSHMRLAFTHVFRTREYKTQTSSDQFGAVSLSFRM
ncbi:MAG: lipid A deacylase LpxR family protein [Rhizomicrobium sp.]|nr:lipid A deacylase LpxR family protein [Rhizomicrobium sp.]